ncbi:helix-turn-helix transcriptional regulator [Thermoflexus sp.]|uniref:helix-turn-helix transcriptional regulator n=1 Tax=Thermoflexus sp. TaxID=1969742 RepID=UPI001761FAE2|nr:helix-turn-helix transcriptional regulator [Thermoflexus sp.]
MGEQEHLVLRRKILGIALRQAREEAGKTVRECAALLGISSARYRAYESGRRDPTLPELEALAWFFQRPLSALLDPDRPASPGGDGAVGAIPELLALRHRIIGLILRQARERAGKSMREVAAFLGCSPRRIRGYESGEHPIPLIELERLCHYLGVSLSDFYDTDSPIGQSVLLVDQVERFRALPPEVRSFVTSPVNLPYLRLAMRLAELPADRLRHIAEDLLEITL